MSAYIAMAGNCVEGLVFYGPFSQEQDAWGFKPETEEGPVVVGELQTPVQYELPASVSELALVITGNVIDGLQFYGPFDRAADDAGVWCMRHQGDEDWWVTRINPPEG